MGAPSDGTDADIRGHKVVGVQKEWEIYYSNIVSLVLKDLKKSSSSILLLSSPLLNEDFDISKEQKQQQEDAIESASAVNDSNKKDKVEGNDEDDEFDHYPTTAKSTTTETNNLLIAILKHTFMDIISQHTKKSIITLLSLSKKTTSAFSQRKTETSRWNIFASMCTEAKRSVCLFV